MRTNLEQFRKIPLYPVLPIVPALLFAGTFVLSILSFAKLRKLSRSFVPSPSAPLPASG